MNIRTLVLLLLVAAPGSLAQIQRSPVAVNVNTQGATTVFISYGNLVNQIAAEAVWCADIVPATPAMPNSRSASLLRLKRRPPRRFGRPWRRSKP